MVNKFTLNMEGIPYEIERRGDLILVNGVEFPVQIKEDSITVNGNPKKVELVGQTAKVDGIGFPFSATGLEEPKPSKVRKAASKGAAEEAGAVTAIMPGLIIKVLKKEGERVEAGDVIFILEAMKMQNELHAKQSGILKSILVKEGETVEMRQVLGVVE